jgi:uncharacterized protein YyaL (SSP411 family)
MADPSGGFYSAEDADSVIDPDEPKVKGEGAFYIWTADEIHDLVPSPEAEWLMHRYGVADGGNVANDPHNEFTNRNILYQAVTVGDTATYFRQIEEAVAEGIAKAEKILLAERAKRVRPHLDDKVLTAWNGLMISAFALGGAVLDEPRYAQAARRAADFVGQTMYDAATGILLRRYRQGDAAIEGFLDDYSLFTQALLDLYETQHDVRDLQLAIRLVEKQNELFADRTNGGYFNSAADATDLVMRMKEDYDGAEPSGNSAALFNLLRLAHLTDRDDFRGQAERLLAAFAPRLSAVPVALPYMLAACEFRNGYPRQVILTGEDVHPLDQALNRRFVPFKVVHGIANEDTRRQLAAWIPAIEDMRPMNGRATAYVCRNYTCQLPVNGVDQFLELLQ